MDTEEVLEKANYRYFLDIATRWMDNDIYGHVNNVIYCSYFDTIINEYLIKYGNLNINSKDNPIGYCISSQCEYKKPISYPQTLNVGISVEKIGKTSVVYNIGIFVDKNDGGNDEANAYGKFVHCFVNPKTDKKVEIPLDIKNALQKIFVLT